MSQPVAVVGSKGIGICNEHRTPQQVEVTFIEGEPNVTMADLQVITLRCRGIASCGHEAIPVTGSDVFSLFGSPVHRVGDTGTFPGGGEYTVITGSNIFSSN